MRYKVEISFKKSPAFSAELDADSQKNAEDGALAFARKCGFNNAVKKIKSRLVQTEL